jgi:hypothetical protein
MSTPQQECQENGCDIKYAVEECNNKLPAAGAAQRCQAMTKDLDSHRIS